MSTFENLDLDHGITPANYTRPPGTELLFDSGDSCASGRGLQFVQGRDGSRTVLVPQPSLTDPNDPLRWSKLKKWGTFLNAIGYSFMGSVTGPIMAAGMISLAETFSESLQRLTYANGATLICQGVGNIFWMPLAIKLGRRPVYMLSNVLMGIACVWLGLASDASYTPFVIGRAFLGLFEAPIESIVPTTITDIFFLHNRGEKVSLYGLSVLGGNELGPLFSALIIQRLGMAWAFYIVSMFICLSCITMFFFMPETKYLGARPVASVTQYHKGEEDGDKPCEQKIENVGTGREQLEVEAASTTKHSLLGELSLWPKPDPDVSFRKVFLRPIVLLAYPTVLWACLLFAEPYAFDAQSQGLVFLSPFVGSLVGSWLCGSVSDSIANYFTRRNGGIREPEMRLPTLVIGTFLTFFGALMAGLTYHYRTHWIGPIVGFGVLTAGGQVGVSLSMSYALDCHKKLSVELMVTVASLKSVLAWIWTWVINDWITASGMLTVFMTIASINVVVHLTTIGLYLKGKPLRIWIHEKDMLGKYGLN
ncbi:Major facilitator superfamily domain general substrate transporter [Fusarium albosuccineum]|uniref:Major facilitator superfamily domain general substrate transporter n=1 Tax=Fusarium albosuccineum TaxID=1237068 RepID=A0A8H4PEC8_9HYPO|nr:Major facilitator superfamily domain general substrate transporter [Fusarium albosuccineum]